MQKNREGIGATREDRRQSEAPVIIVKVVEDKATWDSTRHMRSCRWLFQCEEVRSITRQRHMNCSLRRHREIKLELLVVGPGPGDGKSTLRCLEGGVHRVTTELRGWP